MELGRASFNNQQLLNWHDLQHSDAIPSDTPQDPQTHTAYGGPRWPLITPRCWVAPWAWRMGGRTIWP